MTLSCSSRRIAIAAIALLIPSSVAQDQQTYYDCRTGCSLDANINGPQVCGADNLTYLNECLAFCQNVAVAQYGPCEGSIAEESEVSTDSEVITMKTMTQFLSQGYRFVKKNTKFIDQPDNLEESTVVGDTTQQESAVAVEEIEPYFVLFTPEGYEYAYRSNESLPSYPGPTESYMGMQQQRLRNLAVIGTDTRTVISDTKAFPYRTIGEADFSNINEGGCTLTMISRNAAITAGHCVYSVQNKGPIKMFRIAPGRYRNSSGSTVEPYGTWDVATTQTFGQFKSSGDMNYDLAVVTFKAATRSDMQNCAYVYPGDVVGWLTIDRARTSGGKVSDSRLALSTITGYPADFPDGQMATSGVCSKSWESYSTQFVYHYCDTFGGNSGSAVITSSNVIIAIHAYGFYDSKGVGINNGGAALTGQLYDSVYEWAGLGVTPEACAYIAGPEPSEDCACKDMVDRPFFQIVCYILNRNSCFRRNNGR